jgi:peptide/nickel transport system substrate-binding protein
VRMRTGAVVAGTASLALVLSACGGGSTPNNTNTDGTQGASGYNAAVNGVVNPSSKKGGTLRLVSHDDPDSFDPVRAYYAWVWNFSKGYYARTLVTNQAKPGKDGLTMVPDLAQDLPTISDDKKTYTFKLKSGIKFEDGSTITSKDIKYGIERGFAGDVLSGGPTFLKQFLDQGQNYPGPYKDTDPNKLGLKSVETPDDTTIIFKLAAPFGDFPFLLAMPAAAPVPRAKDTGDKYANAPVSSGPYKFKSIELGKKVVMDRNPNWDPATDKVRLALPDTIELTIGTEVNEIDNQQMDGTQDVNVAQTGVQSPAQAKILQSNDLKKNADAFITGFIRYVSINTKVPPFDNIHCRRAVHYATNKLNMQTARGGPIAGGDIGTNMLPPTLDGHDPNLDPYNTKSGQPQVEKAKEELKQCGKPDGFETVIASRNSGKEPISAEALQQSLGAVGIKARIEQHDASLYYRSIVGVPSNVHAKGYGIIMTGWGADWSSAYGYLAILIDGRQITPSGNNNYAELNDAEINSLIDTARAEPDAKKAAAIWSQINAKVMDQAVMMPFVYDKALNYRTPRLTNVFVSEYYGMYDFGSLGVS